METEPITDYLKRRLKEAGPHNFEDIADRSGVASSFIRKFVYGSRENPRVQTIQPLLDFFASVDRGEVPSLASSTQESSNAAQPAEQGVANA